MPNVLSIKFVDEDGAVAVHPYHLKEAIETTADALVQTLVAKVGVVTNAAIPSFNLLWDIPGPAPLAIANPYDSEDKIRVSFQDALGNVNSVMVPAPLRADMLEDDESFTPLEVDWEGFKTQALLFLVSIAGDVLVAYIKDKRTRKNRKS